MSLVQSNVGSTKNMVALPFYKANIGNSDGTLTGISGVTEDYVMPVGGWIIGMGATLDGTLTSGTLNLAPSVAGSVSGRLWSGGNADLWARTAYATQEAGSNPLWSFQAGQAIGLTWQKTGTIAPTTRDMNVVLLVLLDGYVY